jgi:uncharacterized protein YbcC (UPF0753/DUF2309 family)
MLSRADVREALRARHGIDVPDRTCFVGGYHDTTDDDVVLYDLEDRPATHRDAIATAAARFEAARRRNAHERCRRFEPACAGLSEAAALRHVEDRSEDLAQPRPERGHVTNALCLIGRRAWSRGLFLDRRAFLVSYEPAVDPDGAGLGRLLAAVAPVGAGINLEYYFSTVDPQRYGCGSKLPHNVTGLLGVMDGPASDLRTGLPWQMVEIHEPVRLLCVIEGSPAQVAGALRDQPGVRALVERRWVLVAAFDPERGQAWFLGPDGFTPHAPERTALPEVDASARWYAGHTGFLPPALTWAAFPGPTAGGSRPVETR